MAFIKINSILKKRGQNEVRIIPAAVNGARIKVLVGSCAHCAKLRDNVVAAMKQANIPETELETISDLVKITRMGIITTPALIVDGKLLCCGKVLSVEELLPLLSERERLRVENQLSLWNKAKGVVRQSRQDAQTQSDAAEPM